MKKSQFFLTLLTSSLLFLMLVFSSFQSQTENVSGTWDLVVEADAGTGNPVFKLKQVNDSITGTYSGIFGNAPVSGNINSNEFKFQFSIDNNVVKYMGTVEGNEMKGKVILGPYGEGTFTGKKTSN